jgi:glutamine amidotransferase
MIDREVDVAIIDYGLGNLYSVQQACKSVGMNARITSNSFELFDVDLVILPGVGAYGDAMAALHKLKLVEPLQKIANSDRWLMGICLGMQLLMSESYEFGVHKGLDIIPGKVISLPKLELIKVNDGSVRSLKVPQVGWNQIWRSETSWDNCPLSGLADGEYMYFVHSYFVEPAKQAIITSTTKYGQVEFCSSLQYNSVFACQFHPERSGLQGIKIYENITKIVRESLE